MAHAPATTAAADPLCHAACDQSSARRSLPSVGRAALALRSPWTPRPKNPSVKRVGCQVKSVVGCRRAKGIVIARKMLRKSRGVASCCGGGPATAKAAAETGVIFFLLTKNEK